MSNINGPSSLDRVPADAKAPAQDSPAPLVVMLSRLIGRMAANDILAQGNRQQRGFGSLAAVLALILVGIAVKLVLSWLGR